MDETQWSDADCSGLLHASGVDRWCWWCCYHGNYWPMTSYVCSVSTRPESVSVRDSVVAVSSAPPLTTTSVQFYHESIHLVPAEQRGRVAILALWRPLLQYRYSYKAPCAKGLSRRFHFWHPGKADRQSVRMSTRRQAVARIADRTAKNCRGDVT